MRKAIFHVLICALALTMTGCEKDVYETPSLAAAQISDVTLTAEGQSSTIAIPTTYRDWKAITNADWMELQEAGQHLLVIAQPNTTPAERMAEVIVVAGKSNLQFTIKQATEGIAIEPSIKQLNITRKAAEHRLFIKSNEKDWEVEKPADATWLTLTPRPRYGELIVAVEKNPSREVRTATLRLTSGTTTAEVEVRQEGMPHYFLPYMAWGSSVGEAEAFENLRDSRILLRPRPADPLIGQRGNPDYVFSTVSVAFPQVHYEYVNLGSNNLYKATLTASSEAVINTDEFAAFLADNGYERNEELPLDDEKRFYLNKAEGVYLNIEKIDGEIKLIFYPVRQQPQAVTMPATFPMGFPLTGKSTRDDVIGWEEENQGILGAELTEALGRPFYYAPAPYWGRTYKYDNLTGEQLEIFNYFLDARYVGLYRFGGLDYLTEELKSLVLAAGFTYRYFDPTRNAHYFEHPTKRLRLAINAATLFGTTYTRCQLTVLDGNN